MNNQRGGFLSKIFIIPAGVALMVGFFFLGYYVGKYQSKQASQADKPGTLPEIASQYLPKKEDLTFYKTLTEREDKTVSVDLKPKQKQDEAKSGPTDPAAGAGQGTSTSQRKTEKQLEVTIDRTASPPKQTDMKNGQLKAKKETVIAAPSAKVRFTVQIASYPDKDMAEEEMKRMKKRGYAAFIVASELEDKGTWYRVRLGSFSNKASAEKLAKELRTKEGLSPFVTAE